MVHYYKYPTIAEIPIKMYSYVVLIISKKKNQLSCLMTYLILIILNFTDE